MLVAGANLGQSQEPGTPLMSHVGVEQRPGPFSTAFLGAELKVHQLGLKLVSVWDVGPTGGA